MYIQLPQSAKSRIYVRFNKSFGKYRTMRIIEWLYHQLGEEISDEAGHRDRLCDIFFCTILTLIGILEVCSLLHHASTTTTVVTTRH